MSFLIKDLVCLFLILISICFFIKNIEVQGIFFIMLFLAFTCEKLSYIKSLKNKLKQERELFIKTLNHDLKVATLAQLRAIELLIKANPNTLEIIKEIQNSCNYSLEMIDMMLKAYQFDNNKNNLIIQRFNIVELISDTSQYFKKLLEEKNAKIYIKSEFQNLIDADKALLAKLFQILFSVAILNSEKRKNINVIIKKEVENYVVIIAYQGNLLSQEECEKIFTEKACLTTVGFGIKMYLCKKIVEIHGGTIRALTDGGNVNMFTFKLPISKKKKNTKSFDIYRLEHSNI